MTQLKSTLLIIISFYTAVESNYISEIPWDTNSFLTIYRCSIYTVHIHYKGQDVLELAEASTCRVFLKKILMWLYIQEKTLPQWDLNVVDWVSIFDILSQHYRFITTTVSYSHRFIVYCMCTLEKDVELLHGLQHLFVLWRSWVRIWGW